MHVRRVVVTYAADALLIAQHARADLLRAFWTATGAERRRVAAALRADFAAERAELAKSRAAFAAFCAAEHGRKAA